MAAGSIPRPQLRTRKETPVTSTFPDRRPSQPIRAPRGSVLSCQGWPQEAALRMLTKGRHQLKLPGIQS